MTISFAGMATMYASRITPFSPMRRPGPSSHSTEWAARLASPRETLEMSQMTAPAGTANSTARQRTMRVRSITDV